VGVAPTRADASGGAACCSPHPRGAALPPPTRACRRPPYHRLVRSRQGFAFCFDFLDPAVSCAGGQRSAFRDARSTRRSECSTLAALATLKQSACHRLSFCDKQQLPNSSESNSIGAAVTDAISGPLRAISVALRSILIGSGGEIARATLCSSLWAAQLADRRRPLTSQALQPRDPPSGCRTRASEPQRYVADGIVDL
jgi:hypothetical protein